MGTQIKFLCCFAPPTTSGTGVVPQPMRDVLDRTRRWGLPLQQRRVPVLSRSQCGMSWTGLATMGTQIKFSCCFAPWDADQILVLFCPSPTTSGTGVVPQPMRDVLDRTRRWGRRSNSCVVLPLQQRRVPVLSRSQCGMSWTGLDDGDADQILVLFCPSSNVGYRCCPAANAGCPGPD